jgi:ABC-type transport system substrate-binding protein
VALALCLGLVAGVVACSDDEAPPAAPALTSPGSTAPISSGSGGTLRLGLVGPDTIDPAVIVPTDPPELVTVDVLFDGLTAIDPTTQTAVPALAERWTSDEGLREWTFVLREGVTFSDDTPLTATDVKFSLDRIARKGRSAIAGARLDVIDGYGDIVAGTAFELRGVQALDDRTVRIVTAEPFAQLPELLAAPSYGVVSKTAFEGDLPRVALSGPFTLTARDATTATLVKRSDSAARLDGIELRRFPSDVAAFAAFEAGEIDWVIVPPDKVAEAVAVYGPQAVKPLAAELFFGVNVAHPALTDVRFRRAIVKAVDRTTIATAALPGLLALDTVVPDGVPGALGAEACGEACRYDPVAAKALVAQVYPDGNVAPVQLDVPQDPTDISVAQILQGQLAAAGIPSTVNALPFDQFRAFAVSGQQQVFRRGWMGLYPDPDAYLAPLFLSFSPDNVTGVSSPELDGAIRQARATKDRDARLAAYGEIEKQVLAQAPLLPIAQYQTDVVVATPVRDLSVRLDGTFVVDQVWVER